VEELFVVLCIHQHRLCRCDAPTACQAVGQRDHRFLQHGAAPILGDFNIPSVLFNGDDPRLGLAVCVCGGGERERERERERGKGRGGSTAGSEREMTFSVNPRLPARAKDIRCTPF
jgi:hypothetical protein